MTVIQIFRHYGLFAFYVSVCVSCNSYVNSKSATKGKDRVHLTQTYEHKTVTISHVTDCKHTDLKTNFPPLHKLETRFHVMFSYHH